MIIIPDFVIWRVMNLDDGLPLLGLTLITYIYWVDVAVSLQQKVSYYRGKYDVLRV